MKSTPGLDTPDYSRIIGARALKFLSGDHGFAGFSWQYALLIKGLMEHGCRTQAAAYYKKYLLADGRLRRKLKFVDQLMHGRIFMDLLKNKDLDCRPALDEMFDFAIENSENGAVFYRKNNPVLFVDSAGMVCPFLFRYGEEFKNGRATALAASHLDIFLRKAVDGQSGLVFHGVDSRMGLPAGRLGWGRGLGWYCLGLIDSYPEVIPDSAFKAVIKQEIKRVAQVCKRFQSGDGAWRGFINTAAPADSSATAMILYFYCKAIIQGVIDVSYTQNVIKGMDFLKQNTFRDGTVDRSQTDCISMSRFSTRYEPTVYAQGMALAAADSAAKLYEKK